MAAPPLDEMRLLVPSSGASVSTTQPLDEGSTYVVTISGTFVYNASGTQGRLADANHDEWSDGTWHRNHYVSFDGHNWTPDGRDLANHTYRYTMQGTGRRLVLRVSDNRYDDNQGHLTATIRRARGPGR